MSRPDTYALEALESRVLLDAAPVALVSMDSGSQEDLTSAIVENVVSVDSAVPAADEGAGQEFSASWGGLENLAELAELADLANSTNSASVDPGNRSGSAGPASGGEGDLTRVEVNDLSDGVPDRPVLVVHGIGGSMPSVAEYNAWVMQRGFNPDRLIIDPLKGYYERIMDVLDLNGYTPGMDLWAANYDWRMAPGPEDGTIDGVIGNQPGSQLMTRWGADLTPEQITDNRYDYGVDAFGHWLVEAAIEWARAPGHGNTLPESVDVIAHSTGGLVVRSYIQSAAYGGELRVSFDGMTAPTLPGGQVLPLGLKNPDGSDAIAGGRIKLPKINRFITMGVPMRGAPTPFMLAMDDWGSDIAYEYLGKMVTRAYVNYQNGQDITGPNGTTIRGYNPVLDNRLSPTEFIAIYCPTLKSLTGTYAFIENPGSSVPFNESGNANLVAIDLNDGLDLYYGEDEIVNGEAFGGGGIRRPAGFVDLLVDGLTVIYNGEIQTANMLREHTGAADFREDADFGVTRFWANGIQQPADTDVWYTQNTVDPIESSSTRGDGSVPEISAIGLYRGVANANMGVLLRARVELVPLSSQESTHTGLLFSAEGQTAALEALGFSGSPVLSEKAEFSKLILPVSYLGYTGSNLTATPFPSLTEDSDFGGPLTGGGRALPAADPPFVIPALAADQIEQVAKLLDALRTNAVTGLTSAVELAEEIPLLGAKMADSLGTISAEVTLLLTAGAAAVRALPVGSTVEALADALEAVGILAEGYSLRIAETYVEIAIDLTSLVTRGLVASLGEAAGTYAVSLLEAPAVSGNQYMRLQARIRINLAQAQAARAIALTHYAASMALVAQQNAMAGSVQFGAEPPTTYSDSALDVEAYAVQRIEDPASGDGGITVDEMTSRTGPEQSVITTSGRGRIALRTATSDRKVIYANTSRPIGFHPDVFIDSINFALIKDKFRELLDQLHALGVAMQDPNVQTAMHIPLPFIDDPDNNTLDEILTDDKTGFGTDEFFKIVDILREYCDEVENPNLADFLQRVLDYWRRGRGDGDGPYAHGPFSIGGGFDATGVGFNLVFKIGLEKTEDFILTEEGLGAEASALGLDLNLPATASVMFNTQFTVGMDLGGLLSVPSTGLSRNQVTLEIDQVAIDFELDVQDFDAGITIGFLNGGIVDGDLNMTMGVDIAVNGGNPMTLAQLQTAPGAPWLSFTPAPSGTLSVILPITASIGGTALTGKPGCNPTITIIDGNIFDGVPPRVTASEFDCIASFCSMTPAQAVGMLKSLGDFLEQFRDSAVFDVGIPFTSGTDLGDVFDVSKAFTDKVYYQLVVREIVATGTQTEDVRTLGRFSGKASFNLSLDNGPPVLVSVLSTSTSANQSIEDLVADFNAALTTAGLGASVEAAMNSSGRFSLRLKKSSTAGSLKLTVPDADGSTATPNTDAMVAELGFSETQYSVETADFSNLEEFSSVLSTALAPVSVNLRWVEADNQILMDVSYNASILHTKSFNFDPDLGLGPLLDASASGTIFLTANLGARFTLGFDMNAGEVPSLRTSGVIPPPSTGRITDDALFTLKLNSDRYDLTLTKAATSTNGSLADLIADINALFTAGNGLKDKVIAQASGNSIVLSVLDEDLDGDGTQDVGEDLNGDTNFDSQLGTITSIQLVGDPNSIFFTEVGFVNGDSDCGSSKGLFVENVSLDGTLTVGAEDLEAELRVGVFSIGVSEGYATGSGSFGAALETATGDKRFYLSELFAAAPDFTSLLKVTPTLTASIDICLKNIEIDPDLFADMPDEMIRINVPDIKFPEYNPEPFHVALNPKGLFITLPNIGGLSNFNCLTYLDILQGLNTLVDELEELQGFGFLSQPIPLLNLSVSDLLDYAANLSEMIEGLATGSVDTIETLERDIEDFLKVSDRRLIDLTVDDFSPAALAGGSLTPARRASTVFNPSGASNAIEFRSKAAGTAYNGAVIELVDDGRYTGETNDAYVEWSEANKRLRIYYHSGFTTADTVVSKVNALAAAPLEARTGIAGETGGSGTLSLTALKFSLHYNLAYGSFHSLDLGLEDLLGMLDPGDPAIAALGGISDFVQLEATGSLNVTASADILIEFGIDVSNPCKWVPFLYDSTALTLNAAIRGTDIEFTAAVGALGVFAKDGSVTIDRDGDPTTTGDGEDAAFVIGFADKDLDGRHYFRDGLDFLNDVTVTLEAGAGAELTLCFPTADIPLGSTQDNDGNGFPDNTFLLRIPDLATLFGQGKSFVDIGGGEFEVLLPCLGVNNDIRIVTKDPTIAAKKVRLVNRAGAPAMDATGSLLIHLDSGDTTLAAVVALSTPQITITASATTESSGTNNGSGKVCSSVDLSLPDFNSILNGFNACDLITNAPLLLDGLDLILGIIQDGLQSEVLSRNMPLVGQQLSKAGNFIEDFREGMLADIRAKLASVGDPLQLVRDAIWNVLGKPGLNILDPSYRSASDVSVVCEIGENGQMEILFDLPLGKTISVVDTTDDPIDIDIGIPGLGLDIEGNVTVEIGWELSFRFGISAADGFFFRTDGADPELRVFFEVAVPGLDVTGDLFFLQLKVADEKDGKDANGNSRKTSFFSGEFAVDLVDPNGSGRLSFGEMSGGGFDLDDFFVVSLNAKAEVHLDLEVSFADDSRFPRILIEFDMVWCWDASDPEGSKGDLEFGFNNLQIDLGTFISKFIIPILDEIQTVTKPLEPIIDILTARLPIFSDLAGETLTLLDLAELAGLLKPGTVKFIEDLGIIADLANQFSVFDGKTILINVGGFLLEEDPLGNIDPFAPLEEYEIHPEERTTDTDAKGFFGSLAQLGITFPFLKLSELFKLLTGQPVSFIEYQMPLLEFEARIEAQIPIFPPLYIIFGGSVSATIDLTFGFDSFGLQKYFASKDKNPLDIFDGFYVKDIDDYGNEITELSLTGGLFAGAEIDLLIAEVGVTGGIYADVNFDLRDPDEDGRVRPSEILSIIQDNPLCLFDLSGRLYVALDAFLKVDVLILSVDKQWRFGEITLLEFEASCPEPELASFDANGNGEETATEISAGDLVLHMGEFAALRGHGDTTDGNERFTVRPVTEVISGSQSVEVSFGGYKKTYHGVKSILVKAGKGNDIVDLTGVGVSATVYGGDGDDEIMATRGGGTYRGDSGNDEILAEEDSDDFAGGVETFYGGSGNDILNGFGGDDFLYGEDGDDEIFAGKGTDTADGGNGNDNIWGDVGNDTLTGGAGVDVLIGEDGNDTISGGDGDDSLDGGLGDDKLIGNAGNDDLDGGQGNDVLVGDDGSIVSSLKVTGISGFGNDTLAGGSGDDTLIGGGGNDFLFGGNHLSSGRTTAVSVGYKLVGAALEVEPDGADFLDGGEGNDVLIADDGHSGQSSTFPGAEVGDVVWLDLNENGVQDPGEPGLAGVRVQIHRASDFVMIAFAVTDSLGTFRFAGLATGDYYLLLTVPSGTSFTLAKSSSGEDETDSDFEDSDNNGTGETDAFHLATGEKRHDLDAGILGGTPTISISDASVEEGDVGLALLVFTVSLSSPSSQVVTVCYKTGADSDALTQNALAGFDYQSTEYTLVFEPGSVVKEVRVAVIGDIKDELNETVQVTLAEAYQYTTSITITDEKGIGTIIDDDDAPVAIISDTSIEEVDGAGTSSLTFTVTLSNPSWQTLKIDWLLKQATNPDGSLAFDAAVVGTDYTDASGTLTFGEDVVVQTFSVSAKGDALDEYDERLLTTIARNASTNEDSLEIADSEAVGTILDNDATPFVTIRNTVVGRIDEGHAGNKAVKLEIALSAVSGRSVNVNWNTTRGTALDAPYLTELADFVDTFETVTFTPGTTKISTAAYIIGDTVDEPNEHFFANLLTAENAEIGTTSANPNHAVIEIRDDESGDQGPWYIQFSDGHYTVTEGGTAVITLVRAGNSSHPVAVYWISGGTATAGVDYDPEFNPTHARGQRGLVYFGPGETTKTFEITTFDNKNILGQSIYEGDETILLQLANPQGGPVRGEIKSATVTIIEDDPMPVLAISDASGAAHLAWEKSPTTGLLGKLAFTVTLTGATAVDVTVDYTSISGTAIAENDFTTKSGKLTFPAGAVHLPQTITITTKDDALLEDYEDLFVVLSNPVNATIGDDPLDSDATGGEDSDDRGYGLILSEDLGSAKGMVFFDTNDNGFRDIATDFGYSGIKVTWTNSLDATVKYEGTTDASGIYTLSLPLGDYSVTVLESDLPSGSMATSHVLPYTVSMSVSGLILDLGYGLTAAAETPSGSSGSSTTGANDTAYGGSGSDVLSGGAGDDWLVGGHWLGPGCSCAGLGYSVELLETFSSGVRTRVYVDPAKLPAPGVISGKVWVDSNGDNTENAAVGTESGLRNVQVNLFDSDWVLVATAYTDASGNYSFGSLTACDYRVQVLPPGGYAVVTKGVGTAARNSDVDVSTGLTDFITVAAGATMDNIDAGLRLQPPGSAPWNVSFAYSIYSVRESDGLALISLTGDGNTLHPTAVYYTSDGTALAAEDYTEVKSVLRFGAGETSRYFVVPVIEDADDAEGYETVLLYLRNPQGGTVRGSQPAAVLLIFDNPCPDDDEINGGDGNDTLLGDFGYFSASGVVTLLGGMGNDLLVGGDGDDTLHGEGGNDILEGGTGDDLLDGGSENDTYLFDTDEIAGSDDILEGLAPLGGADTLDFSTTALSVLIDLQGTSLTLVNDSVIVLDLTFVANVIENVTSGSGNDTLRGNASNNILRSGGGDDILEGRGGNDDLDGGLGNDTYLFDADLALGADEIFERGSRDTDTIDFAGTTTQAVNLSLATTSTQVVSPTLTLTITTAPNEVVIGGFHVTLIMINPFTGEAMTSDVSSAIENLYGGSYAPGSGIQDRLTGNGRDNVIWGREGNDVLDGGSSGYDTLKELRAGNWQLSATSLTNTTTGEMDTFTAGTFDEISLTGDDNPNVLDASSFSGVVRLDGAGGDDTLIGGSGTNHLTGGAGNDSVDGSRGYDIVTEIRDADMSLTDSGLLIGGEVDTFVGIIEETKLTGGDSGNVMDASRFTGVARLHGAAGNDFLFGGSNNDVLEGGEGEDSLAGGPGDDAYVFDADDSLGLDTLTELAGGGRDILDFATTELLGVTASLGLTTLQNVNANLSIVLSSVADFEDLRGGLSNDVLIGNDGANFIEGLDGSDRITGGRGNDTLVGGDGINSAGYAHTDVLVESRNANSTTLDGSSLIYGGIVEDTHSGFERAELTGGGGDNRINVSLFTGPVVLDGGEGNDTLIGGSFDDVLIGGGGNDDLRGGTGDDMYSFDADVSLGDDAIRDDGGTDWVDFSGTTSFGVVFSAQSTTIQKVNDNLRLTLGSAVEIENLRGGAGDDVFTANDLGNQIEGGEGNDRITGRGDEDLLIGGNGDDTYLFDLSLTGGIGIHTVLEDVGSGGIDTLQFNGPTGVAVNVSLGIGSNQVVHSSLDLILIRCHAIENVIGTSGADTITGNSLNNRIEGLGGNDAIHGGLGDDTYVFDADSALGTDTLTEDPVEGGTDTLDFRASTTGIGSSGAPFALNSSSTQTINAFLAIALSGTTAFENASGGGGTDFINGNNRDNLLIGNAGDDTLNGLAGNDILEGGTGNDSLSGGRGDDIYRFSDGSTGTDVLTEAANEGSDALDFSSVTDHSITFALNSNTAQTLWTGFSVTLSGTERFENLSGGSLDDVLTGNSLTNALGGGAGNDRLLGRGGADSLAGGTGDDTYVIGSGAGNDLITELAGEGSDTVDFADAGTSVVARIAETMLATFVDASLVTHSINHPSDQLEKFIGSNAADAVTVIPSLTTAFDFTGGNGADSLSYVTGGNGAVQTPGRIELTGFQPVTFRGFETVTLVAEEVIP